jgi:hypothetical protein
LSKYNYNDHVKKDEIGRACSTKGAKRNVVYRILVGKPEGKRLLGRPTRKCEDNIKMHLREIGWGGMDWIDLAPVNTVMNLRVPQKVEVLE